MRDIEEWRLWLLANIKQLRTNSGGYSNSVLTLVTSWKIWIARNKRVFDNINTNPDSIHRQILSFSSEIITTFTQNYPSIVRHVKLVSWNFPGTGKLKLKLVLEVLSGKNEAIGFWDSLEDF